MRICVLLLLSIFSSFSSAYFSTTESAELIPAQKYKVGAELQFANGLNAIAHFGSPLAEDTNFSALIGGGGTDFQTGAFIKWVPIPDFHQQPALGLKGGVLFARDGDDSFLSLRLHPLISKKFETPHGLFIPYASTPFGMTTGQGKTKYPFQLEIGSEYRHPQVPLWTFGAELGIDMHDANSYLSIFASTLIDDVSH